MLKLSLGSETKHGNKQETCCTCCYEHATVKDHKVAMVIKYFFVNFAAHLAMKSSKSDIKRSLEKVKLCQIFTS